MSDQQRSDDPSISDDGEIWRRVPPWHVIFDVNSGTVRPKSDAFADDEEGAMSAVLDEAVRAAGRQPDSVLGSFDGFALVGVSVRALRREGQTIRRDALD